MWKWRISTNPIQVLEISLLFNGYHDVQITTLSTLNKGHIIIIVIKHGVPVVGHRIGTPSHFIM